MARREGARRGGTAEAARVPGQARVVAASAGRRAGADARGLDKELSRLYVYAGMLADQDTRVSTHRACSRRCSSSTRTSPRRRRTSSPRCCASGADASTRRLAAEPRLKPYAFYLRDIVRRAPHTLSDAEEKILADAGPLAGSASNIYGILANADFPYPTITLSDGRTVKVDQAGYARAAHLAEPRRSPGRRCRRSSPRSAASAARSARR